MDRGEVDVKPEARGEPVVEEYHLTGREAVPRSQLDALEEVNDRFANLLEQFLSASLQRSVAAAAASTEMRRYGEFIASFSNPTSLNVFGMRPLIGSALMAVEARLVFSLIDCMFGGNGQPLERLREFTLIERRMVRKMIADILGLFQKAWTVVQPAEIALKKTETKPEFVHLVNPNDRVIVIVFAVKGEAFAGNLHLCLPYLMLEPVRDKLAGTRRSENECQYSWNEQLHRLLAVTPVNVTAELGKTVHTIRDVLGLKVNDVMRLGTGPKDFVILSVDGIPKFYGYPGIVKGSRAVEIVKSIK